MTCIRNVLSGKVFLPTKLLISCLAGALFVCAPAQVVTNIALNPSSLVGGKNFTGTVTISANAPAGGFTGNLTAGDANATVPGTFTVAAGRRTAPLPRRPRQLRSLTSFPFRRRVAERR